MPWFFAQNWNLCYFGLFSYKCGCHGNSLGSLEISDSIFEFVDPENRTIRVRKYWIFFAQNWNCCVFCLFLPKFGCHGNCLGSIEISVNIFEFADPENLTIRVKKSSIFAQKWNRSNFCLFLPKFGCHGNSLGSLKISDSIFNFADPKNLTIRVEKVLDFICAELKSVQFWLLLPKFCCHGNSLGSLKILDKTFEIADPENPTSQEKLVSISCTQMKLCLFVSLADLFRLFVDFWR